MTCPLWCATHDTEPATHRSENIVLDDRALYVVAWVEAPIEWPDLAGLHIESDGVQRDREWRFAGDAYQLAAAAETFSRKLREVTA